MRALDQLQTQTDAAGLITTVSYDLLGRTTQRVEPGPDVDLDLRHGAQRHRQACLHGRLPVATQHGHGYDALGVPPEQVQLTINRCQLRHTAEYDAASRVGTRRSTPRALPSSYSYNAFGYQDKVANSRHRRGALDSRRQGRGGAPHQADRRQRRRHPAGGSTPTPARLTKNARNGGGAVQHQSNTYDLLGKLLSRSDANTSLAESFEYDTLNRLTKSIVNLTPTPLVTTYSYNAIGNLTYKSDVGAYNYPAPGQARPHGVVSVSGGPSTPASPTTPRATSSPAMA